MSSPSNTLHCVVRAPWDGEALMLALASSRPGDALLLLQDGVFAAFQAHVLVPDGVVGYVLERDVLRRGLNPARSLGFALIDEAGFVALAAGTARQVCWA